MLIDISNNLIPIFALAVGVYFLPARPIDRPSVTPVTAGYSVSTDYYHPIYLYIRKNNYKIPIEESISITKNIIHYSKKHNMDPKIVTALFRKESSYNRLAVSSSGAKGLGQIKDFNKPSLGMTDSFDIEQNTKATIIYLKRMIDIYKGKPNQLELGLASYFKGRGTVAKNGIDDEARDYIDQILKFYDEIK